MYAGEVESSHKVADLCVNSSCAVIYARARARIEVAEASASLDILTSLE